jgi:hypothetical protein
MEATTGVFSQRTDAEQALIAVQKSGIAADKVTLLTPGSVDQVNQEVQSIPSDSTEQPGMGKAVGALLGGGIGITGGSLLAVLIPGVGPITALGLLGAGILGAAGAAIGSVAGGRAEKASYEGIPEDEIFVYEDALRKGRSVVIAMTDDEASAAKIRGLLQERGAESVDAAREQWWTGLRGGEEARYTKSGGEFTDDERFFRLGFEAALHSKTRCMEFDQVSGAMNAALEDAQREYPGKNVEAPFIRGYQRGREHYQEMCGDSGKAA